MYISISSYTYTYRYIHIHINIYIHTSSTATTTMTHPHIHRGGGEALETKESQQHQKQAEPHHSPTTTGGGGDHDPSTGGGGGGWATLHHIYTKTPVIRSFNIRLHFLSLFQWPKQHEGHSFNLPKVIVKRLVKAGDHHSAAIMLVRVAKNIQQFPAHVVPILTSVVIECQRAKMPGESYQYACTLMKPEYRKDVSEQYRKKIENIVRKPPPDSDQRDALEANLPCMYCGFLFPESQLDCLNCKNISPFCIASGMRMLKEDWSNCPACNFPARHSVFTAMLQANGCPMCDSMVKPDEVKIVNDPSGQITYYKSLFQASENESAPSAPAPPPPPPP